jgi:uncharacterized protein (TIGR02453 family)
MPRSAATPSPFDRETLRFLTDLCAHNERDWFNAHKERYERHFVAPALAFIEEIAPAIREISPHFKAVARTMGGSLMRIYRDTRFARDKAPYKTNMGIQFRHKRARDVHAPGFYLHVQPGNCFLGAGIWRPDPRSLAAIRAEIVAEPKLWERALAGRAFAQSFVLGGEQSTRMPRGFAPDAPHADDLRRKDFIGAHALADGDLIAPGFTATAAERFAAAAPLVGLLCGALDLDF